MSAAYDEELRNRAKALGYGYVSPKDLLEAQARSRPDDPIAQEYLRVLPLARAAYAVAARYASSEGCGFEHLDALVKAAVETYRRDLDSPVPGPRGTSFPEVPRRKSEPGADLYGSAGPSGPIDDL